MVEIRKRHADPITLDHLVRLSAAAVKYEQALEHIRETCHIHTSEDRPGVIETIAKITEQALNRGEMD